MGVSIWYIVLSGLVAVAMIALLILAARLCYRIEERSGRKFIGRSGLPGSANILPTAFNVGVARDPETQALRLMMNRLLLGILGGFGVLYGLRIFFATGS